MLDVNVITRPPVGAAVLAVTVYAALVVPSLAVIFVGALRVSACAHDAEFTANNRLSVKNNPKMFLRVGIVVFISGLTIGGRSGAGVAVNQFDLVSDLFPDEVNMKPYPTNLNP